LKKVGVLLVNLGAPDKPEKKAVRAYLREFLMDRRVLDIPFIIRFFLVYFIIVPKRLSDVTQLYKSIWQQDSPIRSILFDRASSLERSLNKESECSYCVEAAMTYGSPPILCRFK
jgi:ferrochelatase